ncbi:MAG: vitamin K epoxide reductase family protein [Flavisolibacter sp.]
MLIEKVISHYLQLCQISIHAQFLKQRIKSHPDYPSLLAISDTLDELGITHASQYFNFEQLKELDFPLLIHTNADGFESFEIAYHINDFSKNNEALLKRWDGLVLLIDAQSEVKSNSYTEFMNRKKAMNKPIYRLLSVLSLVALLLLFKGFNIYTFSLFVGNAIGAFFSMMIVFYSIGKENNISRLLCPTKNSDKCNKVLNSKMNRFTNDYRLSDLGVIFFISGAVFLIGAHILQSDELAIISIVVPTVLAWCASLVFLYYQARVIKSWCRMCLMVTGIIWIEMAIAFTFFAGQNAIINGHLPIDLKTGIIVTSWFIIIGIIISFSWLALKSMILEIVAFQDQEEKFITWKRNPTIFISLLQKQKKFVFKPFAHDIILGNPHAGIQLIIVSNPYCRPCANAHQAIDELLKSYGNQISVTIRFSADSNNATDKRTIAAAHLLEQHLTGKNSASEMLYDWFNLMDLDSWKRRWPVQPGPRAWSLLESHDEWIKSIEVGHTPTLIFNKYLFPTTYDLKDLKLLIPSLQEFFYTERLHSSTAEA